MEQGAGKGIQEPDLPEARDGKRPRLDQDLNLSTTYNKGGATGKRHGGGLGSGRLAGYNGGYVLKRWKF